MHRQSVEIKSSRQLSGGNQKAECCGILDEQGPRASTGVERIPAIPAESVREQTCGSNEPGQGVSAS